MSAAEPPDESGPPGPVPTPTPAGAPVADTPPPADDPLPADATPTDATPAAPASGATWSAATSGTAPAPPPPAPTGTAPDTWIAPAREPKRKLTWLWVLLGVLGLIAALVVVAVVLFVRTLAGPIDATNAVLAQIKAENYAAAYRLSCSADRELYTLDQYEQVFLNTKDAEGAIESYDVNYSSVDGNEAEVRYDLEFSGGTQDRYESSARKENGTWRACLFPG